MCIFKVWISNNFKLIQKRDFARDGITVIEKWFYIFKVLYDLLFNTFLFVFSGLCFASDKHAAKINFWKSFILINVSLVKNEFYLHEFYFFYVEDATWGLSGDWRCRCNYNWSCWLLGGQTILVIMFYNYVFRDYSSKDTRSSTILRPLL